MERNSTLYVEIANKIMQDVEAGVYQERIPLPKEEVLCKKYNVGRSTIRRALDGLKKDGLLFAIQGAGTYVKPQQYTQPLSTFYSFTDTLKRSNTMIQNQIISNEVIAADASLAKKTAYPKGTRFHRLLRLRSAQDEPLMLEMTYLPQARFWALDSAVLSQGSLYEYLRNRYSFRVEWAKEVFCPVTPRPDEKTLLHISSTTPCMLLERFSYEAGTLVEYTKSVVRGDKYAFSVELRKRAAPRVILK